MNDPPTDRQDKQASRQRGKEGIHEGRGSVSHLDVKVDKDLEGATLVKLAHAKEPDEVARVLAGVRAKLRLEGLPQLHKVFLVRWMQKRWGGGQRAGKIEW